MKKIPRKLLITFSIIFLGLVLRITFLNKTPDNFLSQNIGNKITLEGQIVEEADVRDSSIRYIVQPIISDIDSENGKDKKTDSKILLVSDRLSTFKYGDKIKFFGKLELPKNFLKNNEADSGEEFDYINYLRKDNIYFLIYRPSIELIESGGGVFGFLYSIKNSFVKNIQESLSEPNSSLVAGVIFGAKQSLGKEIVEDMRKVGLVHIIVLSGYNITVVAVSILSLFNFFGKRKMGLIFGVIFMFGFGLMVGLSSTVVRSLIMSFIAILAKYFGRTSSALRALFIAGFLMVLWNPLIFLYDPSFKLSFMAALGLILFSEFVKNKISFVSDRFGLREIISSTFAVQLFLLPILINMSGYFSVISFLVNPLILPLVPILMLFGFLTGLLGFISSYLAFLPGSISYFISWLIFKVVSVSSKIPYAIIKTTSFSLWFLIIWYSACGLLYCVAVLKLFSITDQFRFSKKSST